MAESHAPYPAEFRQQMIELVRAGRNPAELAREFGCNGLSIRNLVAQAAVGSGMPPRGKEGALTTAEREELTRLRRQVRHLQMERDILAKATAWFADGRETPARCSCTISSRATSRTSSSRSTP